MKVVLFIIGVFLASQSLARSCEGHVAFINPEKGDGGDYDYYYENMKSILRVKGYTYTYQELPSETINTCLGEVNIKNLGYDFHKKGYIIVKPEKVQNLIYGSLTDVDLIQELEK